MIKIKHTEQYQGNIVCKGELVLIKVPHGNFPIPESAIYYCDFKNEYHNGKKHKNGSKLIIQQDCCYAIKPIIISETEEIGIDDWITDGQRIAQVNVLTINDPNRHKHKKIIALPEHFSPEQLQMIIDGKLKDGEIYYLECINQEKPAYYFCTMQFETFIKLNQHNHINIIDSRSSMKILVMDEDAHVSKDHFYKMKMYSHNDMIKFKKDTELCSASEFANKWRGKGITMEELEEKWFEEHNKNSTNNLH